jgi:hypothetical protein
MSKKQKILATAKQLGSVNVIAPVVKELILRGHDVTVYATGSSNEVVGFRNLPYQVIHLKESDYLRLVKGFDKIIVGLSGYETPDGYFLRAANQAKIPSIGVQDLDSGYLHRLGNKVEGFPTILAVMNNRCLETIANEFRNADEKEVGKELASRAKVIGWTAFDNYGKLKKEFSDKDKQELLKKVNLNPEKKINIHFTQNIHPDSRYMQPITWTYEKKEQDFNYEIKVTEAMFETASDMGLTLVVKPHQGEEFHINYTKELVDKHGFIYLPAKSCDTKQLMLASDSIIAGRSTCLTEACLLDKNTGGILPGLEYEEIRAFPPIELGAIPYTTSWKRISTVLGLITSDKKGINKVLSEERENFSVDGKATQRVVNLIENL